MFVVPTNADSQLEETVQLCNSKTEDNNTYRFTKNIPQNTSN